VGCHGGGLATPSSDACLAEMSMLAIYTDRDRLHRFAGPAAVAVIISTPQAELTASPTGDLRGHAWLTPFDASSPRDFDTVSC